jgi:hypothetical protein
MSRGKAIPVGPTAKLASGVTWDSLARLSPDDIRTKALFPKGYLPLPHPNHPEFFDLVLELKLTGQEKSDLVAFMQAL